MDQQCDWLITKQLDYAAQAAEEKCNNFLFLSACFWPLFNL